MIKRIIATIINVLIIVMSVLFLWACKEFVFTFKMFPVQILYIYGSSVIIAAGFMYIYSLVRKKNILHTLIMFFLVLECMFAIDMGYAVVNYILFYQNKAVFITEGLYKSNSSASGYYTNNEEWFDITLKTEDEEYGFVKIEIDEDGNTNSQLTAEDFGEDFDFTGFTNMVYEVEMEIREEGLEADIDNKTSKSESDYLYYDKDKMKMYYKGDRIYSMRLYNKAIVVIINTILLISVFSVRYFLDPLQNRGLQDR